MQVLGVILPAKLLGERPVSDVKARIHAAQQRAAASVNAELLLCKTKNEVVAEYALSGMKSPMSVADYQLIESSPKDLEASLPSVERIEED